MSNSSFSQAGNPLLGIVISEKLSKANNAIWKAQVLAGIHGARLMRHLTGETRAPPSEVFTKIDGKEVKTINSEYEDWYARDQQVLGFLLSSLSREALVPVFAKETAAQAWAKLETMYSSQTRAHAVNTRMALATIQKGSMSVAEYVGKMRSLSDEMAAAGRTLSEEELVEYILLGLDYEYNGVVASIVSRTTLITVSDAYSQLLAFETRLTLQGASNSGASSTNSASRAGRGGGYNRGRGGALGCSAGQGCGSPQGNNNNFRKNGNGHGKSSSPRCQVCKKEGHTTDRCWHRFDEDFMPDEKNAATTATSYNIDNS